jgi:hypothetical protein
MIFFMHSLAVSNFNNNFQSANGEGTSHSSCIVQLSTVDMTGIVGGYFKPGVAFKLETTLLPIRTTLKWVRVVDASYRLTREEAVIDGNSFRNYITAIRILLIHSNNVVCSRKLK